MYRFYCFSRQSYPGHDRKEGVLGGEREKREIIDDQIEMGEAGRSHNEDSYEMIWTSFIEHFYRAFYLGSAIYMD